VTLEVLLRWVGVWGWLLLGLLAVGMPVFRAGAMVFRAVWVPVTWVFSLYVVQAGSARRWDLGGLPRQRSTGLGEKPQATGGGLPWVSDGVGPRRLGGLALPSSGRKV
jgi:hypothetical protein